MDNNKSGFNAVDSVDSKKEFDRSICFTFFESYLEQGELVNMNLGSEACANYFIALCRYALYQEESDDLMIKMLISGLKNTIDAGQNKRAKSFKGEDVDMTNKILKYKEDNPDASYRQIADALGCSKSKVGKVLSNNSNLNSNSNNNSNSNLNNNTVDVDVDTSHSQDQDKENKERVLEDLSDEELKELLKRYKRKEKYVVLQKDFNLPYGSLSNELPSQINSILTQRAAEEKREKAKAQFSTIPDDDVSTIAEFLRCDKDMVLDNLCKLNVDANYMLKWIRVHGKSTIDVANEDRYEEYRKERGFKTYFDIVKMMVDNNGINDSLDSLF